MNKFKVGDKIRSTLGRLTYTILCVGINAYFAEYETETGGKYNTTISNEASYELYVPEPCVGDKYITDAKIDTKKEAIIVATHDGYAWYKTKCGYATFSLNYIKNNWTKIED